MPETPHLAAFAEPKPSGYQLCNRMVSNVKREDIRALGEHPFVTRRMLRSIWTAWTEFRVFRPAGENRRMDGKSPAVSKPLPALAPEDYYFEGPYMVFTAAYHLKRGYCCGSGCRHCPYGGDAEEGKNAGPSTSPASAGVAQDDTDE
ncbi:MAG: DUF5522 domain-containing protein [Terracidiphilus sp.]